MTVSYASNRVTVSGAFKEGTTTGIGASKTLIVGLGEVTSSDVGRLIAVVPNTSDSSLTQIRQITAVSGTSITVHDDWVGGSIGAGVVWRVAHNLEDVNDIGNVALQKIGNSTYRWNADWSIVNNGFLGDVDVALEMISNNTSVAWPMSLGTIVQFGILWGGEGNNAVETTKGCRIVFEHANIAPNTITVYGDGTFNNNGQVVNYYGSLIESVVQNISVDLFQRMRGTARFIGCIFDGPMGGRFANPASEFVDCRMSGNVRSTPAWSLAATFIRDIERVNFFQNSVCTKNFLTYSGVFKRCTFADSNKDILNLEGSVGSVVEFVDCTTFDATKVLDNGSGILKQIKTVNYTLTDTNGVALQNTKILISDVNGVAQGGVVQSDVSGIAPEILTEFARYTHGGVFDNRTPFTIRIRKYGSDFQEHSSSIEEPIKQEVRLPDNTQVVLTEAVASSQTGISLDFTNSHITVNESKSFSNLYDFIQASLTLDVNMDRTVPMTTSDSLTYNFSDGMELRLGGNSTSLVGDTILNFSGAGLLRFLDATVILSDKVTISTGNVITPSIGVFSSSLTLSGNNTVTINGSGGGTFPSGSSNTGSRFIISAANLNDTFIATSFVFDAATVIENTSGVNVNISLGAGQTEPTKLETNGTITFIAPILSIDISAPSLLEGSRIRLYNSTQGSEIDNSVVSGGSGYVLNITEGVEYANGDVLILLATYQLGGIAKLPFRASSTATTTDIVFTDSQVDWVSHNAVGIDGSSVLECSTDYSGIEVEVNDSNNSTSKDRIAAFIVNALTEADGIRNWVTLSGIPVIRYVNAGQAIIDKGVTNLEINNIKNAPLDIVDAFKLRASDGTSLVDNSLNTINYDNTSDAIVIETGVSGLTGVESAKLLDLPDASSIAGEVWSSPNRDVNVATMNEAVVLGSGVEADKWRGSE